MPESTINMTRDDLRAGVAEYLQFTRTSSNWDASATAKIDAAFNSGVRQFYFTPLMPGQTVPHEWSFLKPEYRLPLISGTENYDLPDNFMSIEDPITIESDSVYQHHLRLVSQERINVFREGAISGGVPMFAAVKTRVPEGSSTPRYTLMVWPEPDTSYTLVFRYTLIPDLIAAGNPFALCGAMHSETLLASCIAAAERMYVDGQNIKQAEYMRLLQTSIARDQAMNAPRLYGTRSRKIGQDNYEPRGLGPIRIQGVDF